VRRRALTLAAVFLVLLAVGAQAQETGAAPAVSAPAAVRSQAYCTGFIANPSVPRDLFVVGGADDDFHSVVRQFVQGESIFVSPHKRKDIAVGAEYSVVRPATELFLTRRYQGQEGDVRRAGKPYEDVAQVRVTHVNEEGVVAKVTFSCGAILPGDILIPFQTRSIPPYTLSKPLDHFIPQDGDKLRGKYQGRIIAARNNFGYLGRDSVVYLSLGERQGTVPGERLRIYKVLPPHTTGFLSSERTPSETVGEVVVLSVQAKSCVAMVISSYREISAGDYIEQE